MPKMTNIQISEKTRDRIIKYGTKRETYEEILSRLLDEYEEISKLVEEGIR